MTEEDFTLRAPVQDGKVKVTVMTYYDLNLSSTEAVCEELPVKDGLAGS